MGLKYLHEYDPGYEIFTKMLWWQERGLSETASGYGRKLTSSKMVRLSDGRTRRVYVTCFSNSGTAWVNIGGEHYIVRD